MGKPTALIVEDDRAIGGLVSHVVRRENFEVDVVATGRDAVLRLAARPYSVIVLDLMLPELSGAEVLEYLRSTDPTRLSNVIVMTASPNKLRTIEDQVCGVLVKPFELSELVKLVRGCAQHHASGGGTFDQ